MIILCSVVFSVMLSISDASMSPESNAVDIQGVKLFLDGLVADLNENYQAGMKFYHPAEICPKVCMEDENCTSVFWTNSSNSECRIISNNEIDVEFVPGELYYCKDCKSTKELIDEGFNKGVINIQNVALYKTTNASSYNNATAPINAVDDNEKTHFTSNNENINQWLMVDLVERHFITDIQITVQNDPESMKRGGNLKVCLVDEFDFNDTCPSYSQILIIPNNLTENVITANALKSTMGRFVVLQKINKGQVLEISDLEVRAVVPKFSYQCAQCNLYPNTMCDDSKHNPTCQCMEYYFPINENDFRQCQDPCEEFQERNNICTSHDNGTHTCECNVDLYPVYKDDPCNGCEDPCENFKKMNNKCVHQDSRTHTCECNDGFFAFFEGEPCRGCKDPCENFIEKNNICIVEDSGTRKCECKDGFFAVFEADPCSGCQDPCENFIEKNNICSAQDSGTHKCDCQEGFFAVFEADPCSGCQVIASHFNYKNFGSFGWLKIHEETLDWEAARIVCFEEGGDLFCPGTKLPIMPEELEFDYTQYWIGAKREDDGAYKRVAVFDHSEIPDNSPFWDPSSGEPDRETEECVMYKISGNLLFDYYCSSKIPFICQILVH